MQSLQCLEDWSLQCEEDTQLLLEAGKKAARFASACPGESWQGRQEAKANVPPEAQQPPASTPGRGLYQAIGMIAHIP